MAIPTPARTTRGGPPLAAPHPSAWSDRAAELAAWFFENVVNRTDCFGRYIAKEHRTDPDLTAYTDKSPLTPAVLERHFRARSAGDLIGVHSTVRDEPVGQGEAAVCWSKWLGIDADAHGEGADRGKIEKAMKALAGRLRRLGFSVILIDSGGGFHLLVIFDGPVATEKVFALGKWATRDAKDLGMDDPPEVFPKQVGIGPGEYGNWLRLPGRHHTRDCYSRVYDFENECWLDGAPAVEAILATGLTSGDKIPAEAAEWARPKVTPKAKVKVDPQSDTALARDALDHVVDLADGYNDWLRVGMALTPLGSEGLSLWDSWSSHSDKYQEGSCERKWKSFRGSGTNGVTLGTLFHEAKQRGWRMSGRKATNALSGGATSGDKAIDIAPRSTTPAPEADDDATPVQVRRWPATPDASVHHGLAGDLVRLIEPQTESDPLGLLVQSLVMFGSVVGRSPYFRVEATRHHVNENVVLVGLSSMGRKGTSADRIREPFAVVDAAWTQDRIKGGLSSGEGLISAVRDPVWEKQPIKEKGKVVGYQDVMSDEGVADKRLTILETEYGGALRALEREGNKLSALIRQAWDNGNLATLTKSPFKATNAHVSIIGHITEDELLALLSGIDAVNGFANRFMWFAVKRSKVLPFGGASTGLAPLTEKLSAAVDFARHVEGMRFTPAARNLWETHYERLTSPPPGVLGSVTSRAAPHAIRLAMIYALLDHTEFIADDHLGAGLALWDASAQCAAYIFGDALGDADAEKILAALRSAPGGLTRSQIREVVFQRNKPAARIKTALELLLRHHLVREERDTATGGAPACRYYAINAVNAISPSEGPAGPHYGVNGVNGVPHAENEKIREVIEL